MDVIRNIVRKEIIRFILCEQSEVNQFTKEWGDFILDTSDYQESDLGILYKDGFDHITHNLKTKDFIYRGMSVNDDWINMFINNKSISLGMFWSFDRSISKKFMQAPDIYDYEFSKFKGKNKLLITAKTPKQIKYIDINATIAQNIISSEDELRMIKGAPIDVVSINLNGIELKFNDKNLIS